MVTSRMAMPGLAGGVGVQRSALVIDVDDHVARAVVFARTDGQSRFVTSAVVPSTATPPIDDLGVAAKQAIRLVEEHIGMQMLGPDGVETPRAGDNGVDLFAVTGAPVDPIRLSVLGIGESPLLLPLIAAARRTRTVVDIISDRVRTSDGLFSGVLMENGIRTFRPNALVVVQGDTAGNEWQSAIGTLVGLVQEGVVTLIIIVAADQFQQQAAAALGEAADLRGIDPAEFSPLDISSALEAELLALYEQRVDTQVIVPAVDPPRYVSRIRAGELVTRFLARRMDENVVLVDVSDGAMIHWASPTVSDVIVRPDVDLGRNIRAIFDADLAGVAQWLPLTLSTEDLSHWVLNRALRPNTVADTPQDMAIERGILVELLRYVWGSLSASRESRIDMIVAGAPFTSMRSPALAALALLDAFQPDPGNGIVEMVLDTDGLVTAAGAIGERNPAMAADVIENDLLLRFATAVIVHGNGADGQLAVRGQQRAEGGEVERFTVPFGSVHVLRLNPRVATTITLVCENGYTIGGQRELTDLVVGGTDNVDAGELGLIIDARGRPYRPATDPSMRATRVANWLEDLGLKL
jgi:hypothetical protein